MQTKALMMKPAILMTAVIMIASIILPSVVFGATLLDPLTQTELDTNWVTDRKFPTGGVTSVSFDGRDDVAAIGVVAADQGASSFYYYEGIKKVGDFGNSVQIDMYVPATWEEAATSPRHVGFWTSDDPLTAYPLIVFRNGEDVDAGFYVYDTTTGAYIKTNADVNYDGWNTLRVTLDLNNDKVDYSVNGKHTKSSYAGSDTIGQVFLNHYNDGTLDYTTYWHVGMTDPAADADCFAGGYDAFGFDNQGQCVKFVQTGKDSRE